MATETKRMSRAGKPDETKMLNRRQFLVKLSLGLSAIGAALVGLPVVGFLVAPLLRKTPEQWQPVGPTEQFKVGETVLVTLSDPSPLPWAGVAAKTAAWLRRDDEQTFVAFAVNCTHLGCPVRWLHDASLFMCPCHGGVFYKDGHPAAGPPPRPLTQYAVRVNNGQVEVLPNQIQGVE
jgi:menaquinol-cytochrome c reductase iron-sulfur subunit